MIIFMFQATHVITALAQNTLERWAARDLAIAARSGRHKPRIRISSRVQNWVNPCFYYFNITNYYFILWFLYQKMFWKDKLVYKEDFF